MRTHSRAIGGLRTRRAGLVLAAFVGITLLLPSLPAATRTWTSFLSGVWSDPGNWTPAGVPQNGDTLVFGVFSGRTCSNDLANLSLNTITFTNNGYTITGNAVTLTQGISDNHIGAKNKVSCPIQFPTGGNIFSIGIGQLEVAGNITLNGGGLLSIFVFDTPMTISGAISGNGDIGKFQPGDLYLTGTSANTYTGGTYIRGGAIHLAKTSLVRAISPRITIGDTTQDSALYDDLAGQYPSALSMFIGNRGTWSITNGATVTNLTLIGDSLANGGSAEIIGDGLLTLESNVDAHAQNPAVNGNSIHIDCLVNLGNQTRILSVATNTGLSFGNTIIGFGSSGLTKTGVGGLSLRKNNTYSGLTTIAAGTVLAQTGGALGGSGAGGETRIQEGAELFLIGNLPPGPVINFPETIIAEGGELRYQGLFQASGAYVISNSLLFNGAHPTQNLFEITGTISGPGDIYVLNGTLRFSGMSANTFNGTAFVGENDFVAAFGTSVLELAKPDNVIAVPGRVVLRHFFNGSTILRNLQNGGVNTVELYTGGSWLLNGRNVAPNTVRFYGPGLIDTEGGQLQFTSPGESFQLSSLNISNLTAEIRGRVLFSSQTNNIFVNYPSALNISAQVTGLATLRKTGGGNLILGGNNQFTGPVSVESGELIVNSDNALGTRTAGTTVIDGATLRFNGTNVDSCGEPLNIAGTGWLGTNGALTCNGDAYITNTVFMSAPATIHTPANASLIVRAAITGTGPLTKTGPGTFGFWGDAANTYTGNTFANEGNLWLLKPNGITAVPGNLVIGTISGINSSGTSATATHFQSEAIAGTNVTVNGGSLYDLNGFNESLTSVTLNNGGDIRTGSGGISFIGAIGNGTRVAVNPGLNGASSISGRLTVLFGGAFTVAPRVGIFLNPLPELDVSATIQDSISSSLIKNGGGAMRLGNTNSFTSTFTVDEGMLIVSNSLALGAKTAGTIVNSNASLAMDGNIWIEEEPLTLNSSNAAALANISGSNTWSGNSTLARTAGIRVDNGILNLMSFFDCCAGNISGPGGITKSGPGTLLISGFGGNSYSGTTTVTDGLLEAWRIVPPALSSNVVVDGSNARLRTGRIPAASVALPSTATVTVKNGALWTMNPTNSETIRALLGNGRVNTTNATSLTIDSLASSTFSGVLGGSGALNKRGIATFQMTGNSPAFTGPGTVFDGTLRVDGVVSNMAVTVRSNATLRGGGVVGNVTAVEQDSIVRANSTLPQLQGGDLEMTSLTMATGGVLGLAFYGPSAIGGNDSIVLRSAANLGTTRLSTGFLYPPHEGDVITLLRKTSAGAINGTFSGWPEGTVKKVGDVTVRATYLGGDGNDFTFTVTNFPTSFSSYRLAEGNGNQTVEPDECNLLYVSILNRRTNALVITNAILRANTPGAAVTIARATYPSIPAGAVRESLTAFQFRTEPTLACGAAVEFELVLGAVNEGEFAVTFEVVNGVDCTHPSGACESCFVVNGQFSTNSPTITQPVYFVGAPATCYPTKGCPGADPDTNALSVPYLTHMFTNSTTNALCVTAQLRFNCPSAPTNAFGAAAYERAYIYNDPCQHYLGDSGANGLAPFSFRVPAGSNFVIFVTPRTTNACNSYRLELFGLPCPLPRLAIAPDAAPGKARMTWSTASPGFQLQQTGRLPGTFSNSPTAPRVVQGRYTVTNLLAGTNQFYRLLR